jgi:hypothetical protein
MHPPSLKNHRCREVKNGFCNKQLNSDITCAVAGKMRIIKRMDTRKMFLSIAEALMIYGLIAFSYGILVIHVAQTWSGDWPVDRNLPLYLSLVIL